LLFISLILFEILLSHIALGLEDYLLRLEQILFQSVDLALHLTLEVEQLKVLVGFDCI
jgi:hypothetical protein